MPLLNRKEMRSSLRTTRNALSKADKHQASRRVSEKAIQLPEFQQSHHLAFYRAHDGEIDPAHIQLQAEHLKKKIYLTTLHEELIHWLEFYTYTTGDPLLKNRLGIEEPDKSQQASISADALDLVFLPLVAFDLLGNRLGRGAGYYDRTFEFLKKSKARTPLLVGLAYEFQKIAEIETFSWDIPLDIAITEENIYRF